MLHDPSHYEPQATAEEIRLGDADKDALRALAGDSLLKDPDGPEAMKNTLNPISRFGFQNSLKSLVDVYETSAKRQELLQKFGGLTDVGGRTCLVLVRYVPENPKLYPCPVSEICLDAETFLLHSKVESAETPRGPVTTVIRYSDYRDVDGLKLPFAYKVENPQMQMDVKVTSYKHNEDIPDETFVKDV